mmetsp:Transcript_14497/g.41356  ORF Transcript_14497/g.41356 Transcript_14497/m.41356 type:complete len:214 (-) Transcript_14497:29-670(-)
MIFFPDGASSRLALAGGYLQLLAKYTMRTSACTCSAASVRHGVVGRRPARRCPTPARLGGAGACADPTPKKPGTHCSAAAEGVGRHSSKRAKQHRGAQVVHVCLHRGLPVGLTALRVALAFLVFVALDDLVGELAALVAVVRDVSVAADRWRVPNAADNAVPVAIATASQGRGHEQEGEALQRYGHRRHCSVWAIGRPTGRWDGGHTGDTTTA